MEEWIKEVKKYIDEDTKLGSSGLARLAGVSPAVVSQMLAGKYAGDVDRMRSRITAAIDLHRERQANQRPEQYVVTDQSRTIDSTITYALKQKQSGAVLADSGLGKSTAARHVAAREFGVIYVACDAYDFRQAAFLSRLGKSLGMRDASGNSGVTSWRLHRSIQDRCADSERVIVVDDAHYLVNPDHPSRSPALDLVKDIQAHAGTPFVLLGVPELWHTIQRRIDGGWYAQLRRRLGIVQHLKVSMVQADDVEAIVTSLGARCSAAVLNALVLLAREITGGGYGNVEKAVRWATRDGSKQVTRDALNQYLAATSDHLVKIGRDDSPADTGARSVSEANHPALASA